MTAAHPITKRSGVARGNDNVVGFIADTSSLDGGDDFVVKCEVNLSQIAPVYATEF